MILFFAVKILYVKCILKPTGTSKKSKLFKEFVYLNKEWRCNDWRKSMQTMA